MQNKKHQPFDCCFMQIERQLKKRYGRRIRIKTMQKILHFSSLNAAVQAMRKGFVLTDDGNEGSWISTESLAKYIVHQYVKSINDNE